MLVQRGKCTGLSLLEMVMALFLFSLLVPLFAGIWPIHRQAVNQNRAALSANHICRQVLEDATTSGYSGVDMFESVPAADRTIILTTTREEDGVPRSTTQDFVWSVEVKDPGEEPSLLPGEKLVQVKVEWVERTESKSFEMATILVEAP